jgi:formylglycine-generating enzyme required for sulfatase activity
MPVLEVASHRLLAELSGARAQGDELFSALTLDTMYRRPIAERHRVIFYLGHLDGFDSIQICRESLGQKSPDPELDDLFQAGIDPDPAQLPKDVPGDWPSVEQVRAYVERCRRRVDDCLDRAPEEAVHMALEHRLMHLETLAYMFHNFPLDSKRAPQSYKPSLTAGAARDNDWCEIPAGEAVLGRPRGAAFGWDNEFGEVRSRIPAFRVQRFPVSNGQYLRFVREGGALPHFWTKKGEQIFLRGMFAEVPLPLDGPVYVTELQAEAYAAWLGKSLMSESEFHRAAYGTPSGENRPYPWGVSPPSHEHGNFDFKAWDPESIYATPAGDSAFGVSQLVGNGWEWTNTPFAPFPGFEQRPSYPGYSANFFDDEHYVLKGGSPRTAARLLRPSFRNWFRRDYPYLYGKFRCVER